MDYSFFVKVASMPRGPKGEKRPADVIGNAVHVMRIATGEVSDNQGADKTRTPPPLCLAARVVLREGRQDRQN